MSAEALSISYFEKPDFEHTVIQSERIGIYAEKKSTVKDSFADDVESGLTGHPKYLLPKYLYDEQGSELFEKITTTTEYYPTRIERTILESCISELTEICSAVDVISEMGSGSSEKTKIILDHFARKRTHLSYIPVDVSDILIESSKELINRIHNLSITGIVSEYERGLELLGQIEEKPKLILFLGSSIGNFEDDEIISLLQDVRDAMHEHDYLLIGFDLEKDHSVLNRAYNDSKGITSDFNKNILRRINRELDADFDLKNFHHYAFFNEKKHRIEMHLISTVDQRVHLGKIGRTIAFGEGESIHTENSHKFSGTLIEEYAGHADLKVEKIWKDELSYFALTLFKSE